MTTAQGSPPEMSPLTAEELHGAEQLRVMVARKDPDTFMEYVMRDEREGAQLVQSAVHEEWQRLASESTRLLIWSHVESGKTNQLSIGRVLWELGNNPALRVCVVSNTHGQAEKIVRTVGRYIEQSEELHQVFPKLVKGTPWGSGSITVERPFVSKDASVQATGVHGNVLGSRIDLLIMDDMLDYENTRSAHGRQELWDWYHATLAGRLTATARVWVIGTAFHPEDLLHRMAAHPDWKARRYPVIDPATNQVRWTAQWPAERIERKRTELGPLEFARQMMCVARDDSEARFKREWIERCFAKGNGRKLAYALNSLPNGIKTYTGVDLAVQKHSAADKSVLFTIAVHPNGEREVLEISSGKWSGPEIVGRLIDVHRRFFSIVIVENNAAQDFILQFARDGNAIPLRPFTTGRNKANPEFGVESMATEMANAKWIIPNENGALVPEVEAWVTEMLYYDPRAHTGDRLMASWFAREGARMGSIRVQSGRLDLMSR